MSYIKMQVYDLPPKFQQIIQENSAQFCGHTMKE